MPIVRVFDPVERCWETEELTVVEGTLPTSYTATFPDPLTAWTLPHNLGRFPAVLVMDLSGRRIIGFDLVYVDTNTAVCSFNVGLAGTAVCS